jgi:hypothetical protein
VVALTVDEVDTGAYGNGYGTDEHEGFLLAAFIGDGASTYYLQVTGFDMDYADENAVYLNGNQIGFLSKGPNNGLNAGDVFTLLPYTLLAGENRLEFRQKQSGWVWGVTNLAVLRSPPPGAPPVLALTVDEIDVGSYGNNYGSDEHESLLAATFASDGASTYYLQVTGFDMDYVDENAVYLNGTRIGFLSKGLNNGLNAGNVFILEPASLLAGQNTLEFRQKQSGWVWGVTRLGVLTSVP